MSDLLPFGPGAWLFFSCYLFSLLLLGWLGRKARKEDSLEDFYLAGRGFGFSILFLTLYATQYSGNTVFGVAGATYRLGFAWIISIHYMMAIIVFYQTFAYKLHRLAHARGYITPVDYLRDRFNSRALATIASIVMIVALSNYLLAQLMTMGRALQGLAGPAGDDAYNYGVMLLALIMVIYGTLGGIRAIAWTDVIQGAVLFVGFLVLLFLMINQFGPLSAATDVIAQTPNAVKLERPDASMLREWLSYILLVGIGGALYPQAIQRIYSAKSVLTLKRSFAAMAFMPFISVLIAVIAGIYALAYVPGLEGAATDQALASVLRIVQEQSLFGYALVVLIFSAVLAALMSTADSAMLSISSMLTKDIYAVYIRPGAPESELTRLGKRCSWIVVAALSLLAIVLKEQTSLIGLLDRKFDLLVQLAPAFMLGINWPGLRPRPVLVGLVLGLVISLTLAFGPFSFVVAGKVWGFHPGLYGLAVNLVCAVGGSIWLNRRGHSQLNNLRKEAI
ncbi:MAG: sodium:solute symporter family protein [Proteobacteria bacterium]|nr:sodium:solute symporter family protein [Pseudomonadota bacterium]